MNLDFFISGNVITSSFENAHSQVFIPNIRCATVFWLALWTPLSIFISEVEDEVEDIFVAKPSPWNRYG